VIAYVDSSVLLRFVLDQPDQLKGLHDFAERITSAVTEVECLRAVDASRLRGDLNEDEYSDRRSAAFSQLRRMRRVVVSGSILRRAGEPLPAPLKALDAIHVATALQWRDRQAPDLVFATHDRQLGRAASALGFPVIGV
jgi:predicted nucleic acid-binding protein